MRYLVFLLCLVSISTTATENIRKVATWNMKWLGTASYNQLDAVENVPEYSKIIIETGATLFALQEIGVSHSLNNHPKCYYLDLIVDDLNKGISEDSKKWTYIIDKRNKNQRLAYLYKMDEWNLSNTKSITPGNSFQHIRRPFLTPVEAKGANTGLKFNYINIHLKAFPDEKSRLKREENFEQLAIWIENTSLDDDVLISGDTNIYIGEASVQEIIKDIGYEPLYDAEKTSIHEDRLSQRFDRFYSSPGLLNEIHSAKNKVGSKEYIDVIKNNDPDVIIWYDQNISDHYPVVLNIDVSEER